MRHPPAIALMTMALVSPLVMVALDRIGWLHARPLVQQMVERFPLEGTLFHGMLGILPDEAVSLSLLSTP